MNNNRFSYYYGIIDATYRFLIPPGKDVLYYGLRGAEIFDCLKPAYMQWVNHEVSARENFRSDRTSLRCAFSLPKDYVPDRKYDYVILDYTLGNTLDIYALLEKVFLACHSSTRVVIHQQNYLWGWLLKAAGSAGLKRPEETQNWLSVRDIRVYLQGAGFEVTRVFKRILMPLRLGFLGPVKNFIGLLIPLFDFFKLSQFIIARPLIDRRSEWGNAPGMTICMTVRNEKGNIEPVVRSIPAICEKQEILFVEGHSTDGTREEIERVSGEYPEKNIRLIGQPGTGQGDAIRVGFQDARHEIIVLFDADGTHNPDNIRFFYEAIRMGRFEFIEGSRFVYPLPKGSMPMTNQIGNLFFSWFYTLFLWQPVDDVLSGIKAIAKRDYGNLFRTWGFLGFYDPFGDFELLFGSARYGLKIGSIPMHYRARSYGQSKTRAFYHGFYLLRMAFRGFLTFRDPRYAKKMM